MMKSVIIGAGKYGAVYLSYLKEAGIEIIGFLDDDPKEWEKSVDGIPVLGSISKLESLKPLIMLRQYIVLWEIID